MSPSLANNFPTVGPFLRAKQSLPEFPEMRGNSTEGVFQRFTVTLNRARLDIGAFRPDRIVVASIV